MADISAVCLATANPGPALNGSVSSGADLYRGRRRHQHVAVEMILTLRAVTRRSHSWSGMDIHLDVTIRKPRAINPHQCRAERPYRRRAAAETAGGMSRPRRSAYDRTLAPRRNATCPIWLAAAAASDPARAPE